MSTHTPGPWYAKKLGGPFNQGLVIDERTGANIAVVYDNAHTGLLATAPELLGALKAIIDSGRYDDAGNFVIDCEPWDGQGDPPDTCDPLCIQTAWTLIAKAEGRV